MRRPFLIALLLAAALLCFLAAWGLTEDHAPDAAAQVSAPRVAMDITPPPCAITAYGTRLCGDDLAARCRSLRQGWWNHTTHRMEYRYAEGNAAACVASDRYTRALRSTAP